MLVCLCVARNADAQWFFAGYLGANATKSSSVSVTAPASNLALRFDNVEFEARPFESPQYYGWRLGKLLEGRRVGLEFEFIHLKMYGDTGAVYPVTAGAGSVTPAPGQRMDTIVQRYAMTHGLNFLLANLVMRKEVGDGRAAIIGRAGAGVTIPHTETTVLGGAVDQYEYAGPGVHAAVGLDLRMAGRLSFVTEYKFTWAKPEITIAGGRGQTTAFAHHVAFGVAFGLSR